MDSKAKLLDVVVVEAEGFRESIGSCPRWLIISLFRSMKHAGGRLSAIEDKSCRQFRSSREFINNRFVSFRSVSFQKECPGDSKRRTLYYFVWVPGTIGALLLGKTKTLEAQNPQRKALG